MRVTNRRVDNQKEKGRDQQGRKIIIMDLDRPIDQKNHRKDGFEGQIAHQHGNQPPEPLEIRRPAVGRVIAVGFFIAKQKADAKDCIRKHLNRKQVRIQQRHHPDASVHMDGRQAE